MTELLTTLAIIFIVAGPFLLLASYLRIPVVPVLIVAGLVAGGFIDETLKLEIARLGIALLVFTFAVRIQTQDIQTAVVDSEVTALDQMAIVGSVGFGTGLLFGLAPEQAIYLGIAGALSSSIAGSTLFLPGNLERVHNRLSESIHSIQDFAALFLLLVVSAGVFELEPIAAQLGYGVLLLSVAVAVNRYLFDRIGRFAGGVTESMLVGTVALLLLFLAAAEFLGTSIVAGAFAAGIAVQYDPVTYSGVFNGLDSINEFFAAVFFITVGALVAFPTAEVIVLTLVLVVIAGIVKPAVTIALLMLRGYERRTATLTGFNLDQIGEFALIIAIEALFLGLLAEAVFEAIILAAAITLVTSSFTRTYDEEIYHALASTGLLGRHGRMVDRHSEVPEDISGHVVIVGYGRHGRRLVETCEEYGQPYVVIESNPVLLADLRAECEAFTFGDVIESKTVEKARLTDARIVISTVDTRPVNEHLISFADRVDVVLRTKERANAGVYLDRGALYVAVSDLLAADRLEEQFETLIDGEYERKQRREEVTEMVDRYGQRPRSRRDD